MALKTLFKFDRIDRVFSKLAPSIGFTTYKQHTEQ
jgi:hypothetical protein